MVRQTSLSLAVVASFCAASLATVAGVHADTISYVGVITNTSQTAGEVTSWRTSTVAKTYQINGNNVYGSTLGANDWNQGTVGNVSTGSTFGWTIVSSSVGTNFGAPSGYAPVDVPTAAPTYTSGQTSAGLVYNNDGTASFTFGLEGTQSDYTGKVVRVGIMQNVYSGSYGPKKEGRKNNTLPAFFDPLSN